MERGFIMASCDDKRQQFTVNSNYSQNPYITQAASQKTFYTPTQQTFDSPDMEGSIQRIMAGNTGEYVVIEFLIGTAEMVRKQGILYSVGTSYVTLYDDVNNYFILCDIFSIKFVYFFFPGQRPSRNYNVLSTSNGTGGRSNMGR